MPQGNITLSLDEIFAVLEKANEVKNSGEPINKVDGKYINPTAMYLLTKFAGHSDAFVYEDGSIVEKSLIKSAMDQLGDYDKSEYVTGQRAEKIMQLIFDDTAFLNNFTTKYGDELTIPMDMKAHATRQLISTLRGGGQLNVAQVLPSILGAEMFLKPIERQWDIQMIVVQNNLYNPNFESEMINQPIISSISGDILDLATNGISDNYDPTTASGTITTASLSDADFLNLGIGHESLLKTLNGTWRNNNSKAVITGRYGHLITPNRMYIDKTEYTPAQLLEWMDTAKRMLPAWARKRKDLAFVMSQEDADTYDEAKRVHLIGTVGINTSERDALTNNGLSVPHGGIPVKINPKKESILDGGNFYLGALKELYIGAQRKVSTTREYKARMAVGGEGIEWTKHMLIDFQIGLRNAFVIACDDSTNMKTNTPLMITSVTATDGTVYNNNLNNHGTAYTSSTANQTEVSAITVYDDTPKARIFYQEDSATDAGTDLPVDKIPVINATAFAVSMASNHILTTVTTLVDHGLTSGQKVTISGSVDGDFDSASAVITVIGTKTFTLANATPTDGDTTTGTATVNSLVAEIVAGALITVTTAKTISLRAYRVDANGNLLNKASDIANIKYTA